MQKDQQDLQEKAKKVEEIYNRAIEKLSELSNKQKNIIKEYVKELEDKKVTDIRRQLGL